MPGRMASFLSGPDSGGLSIPRRGRRRLVDVHRRRARPQQRPQQSPRRGGSGGRRRRWRRRWRTDEVPVVSRARRVEIRQSTRLRRRRHSARRFRPALRIVVIRRKRGVVVLRHRTWPRRSKCGAIDAGAQSIDGIFRRRIWRRRQGGDGAAATAERELRLDAANVASRSAQHQSPQCSSGQSSSNSL